MSAFDHPFPFVSIAVREGLSATAALEQFREAGGRIRTQTWYAAYSQARLAAADFEAELGRPLNRRPVVGEIRPFQTVRQTGFIQQVTVFQRDRATGVIIEKDFSIRAPGVVSRRSAVQTAIDTLSDFADEYDMQVLGGLYTGTYELGPELE